MHEVNSIRENVFNYLEVIASSTVSRESINPEYIASTFNVSSETARKLYLEWLSLYREPYDGDD